MPTTMIAGYKLEILSDDAGPFAVRVTHREGDSEALEGLSNADVAQWLNNLGLKMRDTTWEAHGDVSQAEVEWSDPYRKYPSVEPVILGYFADEMGDGPTMRVGMVSPPAGITGEACGFAWTDEYEALEEAITDCQSGFWVC